MQARPRWEKCIHHRGQDAETFLRDFFADKKRRLLLIGGAGFDPRSISVARSLADVAKGRIDGLFIREERPNPNATLRKLADANTVELKTLFPNADVFSVDVFDTDNAPVGGRRATHEINRRANLDGITDVVLDSSALSVGIMFPIARYCLHAAQTKGPTLNFHLVVQDDPQTDASILGTACGKSAPLHTFQGEINLDSSRDAAKLWLPQLGKGKQEHLKLIFEEIKPHAVCPIIPFPSRNPRSGDSLIEEYGALFETMTDPMTPTWNVDSRDIVYAHEKSPLDLYRSVLKIDNARKRVFAQTGGSKMILSPLGSKAVGVGLLMAALDRNFAVVSVETIEYKLLQSNCLASKSSELVHVWLHGEAYAFNQEARNESIEGN